MAKRVGERDQPAFGSGIRFRVRLRHQRAARRHGDDRAFWLCAARRAAPRRASRKVEVRLVSMTRRQSSSVMRRSGRRTRTPALATTRVEPAEALDRERDGIAHRILVGGVGPSMVAAERAPAAELLREPAPLEGRRPRRTSRPSSRCKRDGTADAVGRTGDECNRADRPRRARASEKRAHRYSFVAIGKSGPSAPFGPGAVIERLPAPCRWRRAQNQSVAAVTPRAAARDDRLVEIDAAHGEPLLDLVGVD